MSNDTSGRFDARLYSINKSIEKSVSVSKGLINLPTWLYVGHDRIERATDNFSQ